MTEDFARKVLSIPVAQVVRSMSFETAEQSSLEVLTDIMQAFIEEVGYRAQRSADIAGRNESNFHDILFSLQDLGISIDNVIAFYQKVDIRYELGDIRFPEEPATFPGILRSSKSELPEHIPSFLPVFPDDHTYKKVPLYDYRETNPKKIRELKAHQSVQAENYLASLHQHTSGNQGIINYDQINDPKTAQTGETLFKPAKDISQLTASQESEVKTTISMTPLHVDSERVTSLLSKSPQPSGAPSDGLDQEQSSHPKSSTEENLQKILNLRHRSGGIDSL
ncbi:transcription initiation factor TFIID subunit 8-like [Schistocerca gregaria]|uniref:transcription initiation factor TFIID subunit 8-like n=1 Tax=Schistocerca gregaria TaxID=7010 RepID=UPI00211F329A|nr:transcription initiation factor TFIID subunit 8-like [Schistocerca gregaria]